MRYIYNYKYKYIYLYCFNWAHHVLHILHFTFLEQEAELV
jgi:hypothetical protein